MGGWVNFSGGGVVKKRQSPDVRSSEVGISAVMKSGAPLLGLAKYIYILYPRALRHNNIMPALLPG